MNIDALGIASVAAITVVAYLVGMACKEVDKFPDKWIPVVCGAVGCAVGLIWYFMGWADYPANDPVTAAAVGIISGFAATGINQIMKQAIKEE